MVGRRCIWLPLRGWHGSLHHRALNWWEGGLPSDMSLCTPCTAGLAKAELLPFVPRWLPLPHSPGSLNTWPFSAPQARSCTLPRELEWLELRSLPRPRRLPGWLNTSQFSIRVLVVLPPRTLLPGQIGEAGHSAMAESGETHSGDKDGL